MGCDMALYDNDIYKYMSGLPRFWVEWDKYTHTHEKVSIHWFKKLCKRCGLSSREMRTVLRDGGHIEKRSMPCHILKRAEVYFTYNAWNMIGYQVRSGETSYYRNSNDTEVFSNNQVHVR